jgi:DNA polymerase/3'-5' exonuclease PolX
MNSEKAHKIFNILKSIDNNFYLAGSARRGKKEDLHDLDVVYMGTEIPKIPGHVAYVKGKDIVRYTIMNEQVDIYRTDPENFGAMYLFLTGPQEFNIIMRGMAKRKNMLLNQRGLYDRETRRFIVGENEEQIFNALGLEWKTPDLRGKK